MVNLLSVDGLPDVEKTLRVLAPRESRNLTRRLVVRIARHVRDDVRAALETVVDRKTGNLFAAIRSKRERGASREEAEASVTINLKKASGKIGPHWHFIEFGTVKQKATPFIEPTVRTWVAKMPRVYREEFGRQLERTLAKRGKR